MRPLTLLPGVITPGEASSGLIVRGGGTDQNLILMDGVPLYNLSHLFDLFSAFNVVKKGGFIPLEILEEKKREIVFRNRCQNLLFNISVPEIFKMGG